MKQSLIEGWKQDVKGEIEERGGGINYFLLFSKKECLVFIQLIDYNDKSSMLPDINIIFYLLIYKYTVYTVIIRKQWIGRRHYSIINSLNER